MARTTTNHTVVFQTSQKLGVTRLEAVGSVALLPGWMVEIKATGAKLGKPSAGTRTEKLVVLENNTPDTHSYPTTAAVDIPYSADDTVYYTQAQAGDVLNLWLQGGETVVKGQTWLSHGTGGKLKAVGTGLSGGTSNPIGRAWESKTATGTSTRCQVRIV